MLRLNRRRFLGITAGSVSAGALAFVLRRRSDGGPSAEDVRDAAVALGIAEDARANAVAAVPTSTPVPPTPTPIPEPPVMPRGREEVALMAGTEWEARGTIFHSGLAGPRLMVLGGVHGNEPGGWLGAEGVRDWEVARGMLIVLPRINHRAAAAFERTLEGTGDLNRLYPGDPLGPPMAQMAAEIVALATQWRPHYLWDMHESWGFFNERGSNSGTAFIGQTVTTGDLAAVEDLTAVLEQVNGQISTREAFSMRTRPGGRFGGDTAPPMSEARRGSRGSSSLSIGTHVAGVRP
ncbi:MAG: succinylglutamate desuccinylase/aspartoacylase family protein, partial [Dehalococcoidia bacterium]